MPKAIFLDVGHGNSAIIEGENRVFVIDCAPGGTLIDALDELGITEIAHVLLSHADEDHIGGMLTLLLEKQVHNVHLNPDAVKKSATWMDLRYALAEARKEGGTVVHPSLTTNDNGMFEDEQLSLEVLAPHPEDALGGVGGRDIDGRKQVHNTMSAVIKVIYDARHVALLPGDMDHITFEHIRREEGDLHADVLVFPHHGGAPSGADPQRFAKTLCDAVEPTLVIFSVSRAMAKFPRQEIITGVRQSTLAAHIVCTQLSPKCSPEDPDSAFEHLNPLPARGKDTNACCGGSVVITLGDESRDYKEQFTGHIEFININVPTPMCMRSKDSKGAEAGTPVS